MWYESVSTEEGAIKVATALIERGVDFGFSMEEDEFRFSSGDTALMYEASKAREEERDTEGEEEEEEDDEEEYRDFVQA